jgi:pre-60S factor REI1
MSLYRKSSSIIVQYTRYRISFLDMSSPSPYTCITCHVAFQNGELQRAHYKSDWHRYNLKRKVADLGPITANEFTDKVEAIQQRSDKNTEANIRTSCTCKDCGKAFTSENGLLNHVKSKKHIDTIAKNATLAVR